METTGERMLKLRWNHAHRPWQVRAQYQNTESLVLGNEQLTFVTDILNAGEKY